METNDTKSTDIEGEGGAPTTPDGSGSRSLNKPLLLNASFARSRSFRSCLSESSKRLGNTKSDNNSKSAPSSLQHDKHKRESVPVQLSIACPLPL
eukprot:scaffold338332_cov30-Prasinocladus_malaysianus.AAC.1